MSPIDKYLTIPKNPRTKSSAASRAVTGARVLTSAECFAIIKEKEQKKRRDEEEKANRKKIREEKKKQREDEKAKKADEKAKKAEERIRKANERDELKARKAEERNRRAEENSRQTLQNSSQAQPSTSRSKVELRSRQQREEQREEEPAIVSDVCCVCNQSFQEDVELGGGVEWIQCSCTRWLHEDCVVESTSSSAKLCPFC